MKPQNLPLDLLVLEHLQALEAAGEVPALGVVKWAEREAAKVSRVALKEIRGRSRRRGPAAVKRGLTGWLCARGRSATGIGLQLRVHHTTALHRLDVLQRGLCERHGLPPPNRASMAGLRRLLEQLKAEGGPENEPAC